jgi:hypothetical protein
MGEANSRQRNPIDMIESTLRDDGARAMTVGHLDISI